MLAQFRALAKSPIAIVLLGLIGLSFVVWQSNGASGGGSRLSKDAVVQAGSRSISSAQFKRIFDGYLQQVSQQSGRAVTAQEAAEHGLDRRAAESIGDDLAFAELIKRAGLNPSDKLVASELRKSPAFFDPISGRFDKQAYQQRLAQAGLTVPEFEQSLRDEIAQTHFVAGLVAGLRAPLVSVAVGGAYNRQGRSFSYFALPPQAAGAPVQPTDAQLTQFMKEHAAQLTRPATRTLSLVRFSTAQLAPNLPADPAAVQKRFDFMKDTLSQPEKRTLVQIVLKDGKAAADVSAKLKSGVDPAQAAKLHGGQVLPLQGVPRTAISDAKVAAAAFGLKVGDTSGPIQGDLNWAVVKLYGITPGHVATLEEARPKIEAEVKKSTAQERVYAQVQKYEDARGSGAGMIAAAKTVGAAPANTGPITEQGANAQGQPTGLPPQVLAAAFKLPQGGESDTIDLGGGEWVAVRVEQVAPPSLPPLDEVRQPLTRAVVLDTLLKSLRAKADQLAERVRKGESVQAAAASVGATAGQGVGVLRDAGGQTFSKDLIGRVFAAKRGEVVIGEDVKLGIVLAKLEQITAPAAAEIAPVLESQRQTFTRALFEDLGASTRASAHTRIKPVVDPKRASVALGVTKPSAPAAP